MSRILITGSKGFIGEKLKKFLLDSNYEILEYIEDIRKPINFDGNFDVVIHLAAKTSVVDSLNNPLETMEINVLGTLNVLEFSKSKKAKVIFISTAGIYDLSSKPVGEEFPISPKNPYVQSKYLGEELCRIYSKTYNICCTVLRLFNVYGYPCKDNRITQDIMNGLLNDKQVELSSPNNVRDYVHLDDVLEAIKLSIIYNPEKNFNIFNIGSGVGTSVKVLVNVFSIAYGKEVNVKYTDFRKSEVGISIADITKAEEILGWRPKISLIEGVKMMVTTYS